MIVVFSPKNLFCVVLLVLVVPTLYAMETIILNSAAIKNGALELTYSDSAAARESSRLFIAVAFTPGPIGSAILPYGEHAEGSTVFLPFQAQQLLVFGKVEAAMRSWTDWQWQPYVAAKNITRLFGEKDTTISIPIPEGVAPKTVALSFYRKTIDPSNGWGEFISANDPSVTPGPGDKTLANYDEIDLTTETPKISHQNRLHHDNRAVIYQLFVRHFSNTNATRKTNGTLAENGVGKFSGITDATLDSLKTMGITHLWLTGVLQQATGTDYAAIGAPADDPDLLKGIAGSPYAIKDYFDVSPDFADEPANRLVEFRALLERIHAKGMRAMIDFVPNHVARSYASDIRPDMDFGKNDDRSQFFLPTNNFYYLQKEQGQPPLRLPTQSGDGRDGLFDGERDHGKVTGNNVATFSPGEGDWYETIKLNFGYNFLSQARRYPSAATPSSAIPETWEKMDAILAYWQEMGVDGFRCDMSHMIPPEFWKWAIHRARERHPKVWFMAEAYNNDPAKVPAADSFLAGFGNVMIDLLDAGFNAVYDDPSYKTLKGIYDDGRWANDLQFPGDYLLQNSLRYAENHDEVRLASKNNWGNVGAKIGPAISAVLFGISRGPLMIYNGQEYGETAEGVEGFGKDDGRSSIFDYWSLPVLVDWFGNKLSDEQKALCEKYTVLLADVNKPPFTDGSLILINELNKDNPNYGRLGKETASGHWLYGFQRGVRNPVVMLVNLHASETMHGVKVIVPGGKNPLEIGDIPPASWVIKPIP